MATADTQRPNVLCFITDQQRQDHMGCAGNPLIRTPNTDLLANCSEPGAYPYTTTSRTMSRTWSR